MSVRGNSTDKVAQVNVQWIFLSAVSKRRN